MTRLKSLKNPLIKPIKVPYKRIFALNREEYKPKKLNKNTLATTIVEECRREDTGVGLSIALGSQEQKTVIEDLANTPKKLKKLTSKSKKLNRQKSLKRFKNIACNEPFWAFSRPKKFLIRKKLMTPIISHPKIKK